jgi:hypothetical protein
MDAAALSGSMAKFEAATMTCPCAEPAPAPCTCKPVPPPVDNCPHCCNTFDECQKPECAGNSSCVCNTCDDCSHKPQCQVRVCCERMRCRSAL